MNRIDPSWAAPASASPSSSCHLRLTHSRGAPRDGRLIVGDEGLALGDALRQVGEALDRPDWQAANLCRIGWTPDRGAWTLINDSPLLACAIDGARVPPGASVVLTHQCEMEVGLHRFVVQLHERPGPGKAGVRVGTHADEAASAVAADGAAMWTEAADAEFDLRALAVPPSEVGGAASAIDDPFQVLSIDGASAPVPDDPLARWLGAAPVPARPAAPARALHGLSGQGVPTASIPVASGLLHDLHEEFVRVVRDPSQLLGRADWEGLHAPGTEPAPSLDQLSEAAQPYALLRDILQPREKIDRVIEDFDPLGRSTVFDEPPVDDVLRLFAPELSQSVRVAVPGLTQQEHHELAPDSHMYLAPLDRRSRPVDTADEPGAAE
ncbi:TagK domain-containing protein [uncultured Pseudacidovorax sp.]|uniref:TagK domain-containing protein n=1 Tax=uncultured Pseudacidovorax sp. TaxID=679313 RepID=UPI0025EE3001|nr:TagK domain-containing protein [uncultured Pseudacidovorax sp.]